MVGAGLERDIGGCVAGQIAGLGQCLRLGMAGGRQSAVTPRPTITGAPSISRTMSVATEGLEPVRPSCQRARRIAAAMYRRSSALAAMMSEFPDGGVVGNPRGSARRSCVRNPRARRNPGRPTHSARSPHHRAPLRRLEHQKADFVGGDFGLAGAFETPHDARYGTVDPLRVDRPLAQRDLEGFRQLVAIERHPPPGLLEPPGDRATAPVRRW